MELLADDVVIIAAGRLVAQGPVDQVIGSMTHGGRVRVRTPAGRRAGRRAARAVAPRSTPTGTARCWSAASTPRPSGRAALAAQVELHELITERPDLEQVFLELTDGKADIR